MPTPVSNARQCLSAEAAATLDDAVAVARRRGHAQTTSVHVVYALLVSSSCPSGGSGATSSSSSSSSSLLRDALSRARSTAYSPRLQFKALELCFGVALDRLPSSTSSHHHQAAAASAGDDPPVSNSLMAAVKRSQANQRRNPDTFHLYQQQQQQSCAAAGGVPSSSSFSGVKVELQQLVLAILDDPVVSRVFGDAGFRSTDIKLAVLRPPPPILRFPRAARCPPLFLCNFSAGDGFESAISPRGFVFPFAAASGHPSSDAGDDNCRRIGEILARRSGGRNPMLVGVGAAEAAQDFSRAVERKNWVALPPELHGIKLMSMEKEMAELRTSSSDRSAVVRRLDELVRDLKSPGAVLSVGDLKEIVEREGEGHEEESFAISEITRLLEVHAGRLWVMGWSATYETYMKFLSRYPLLDKDWDLQLLPITSVRAATGGGGSFARPPSLMESFVPFGGFFPTTYEPKSPLSNSYPSTLRCEHCNEKYEKEAAILLKAASVEEQHNTNLPFWLRKGNMISQTDAFDVVKAKDDKAFLNSKIVDLQKKWNEYCQTLHQNHQIINNDKLQVTSECASNQNSEKCDIMQNTRQYVPSFPIPIGLQNKVAAGHAILFPLELEQRTKDLVSSSDQVQRKEVQSHQATLSDVANDERASPSSVTSVSTDFVLGTVHGHRYKEESPVTQAGRDTVKEMYGSLPSQKIDAFRRGTIDFSYSSSSSCPDSLSKNAYTSITTNSFPKFPNSYASDHDKFTIDVGNYKSFYRSLIEKVGRQEEALSAIVQAVACCRTGERHRGASLKGDIWLGLHGSDRVAKKKTALALAELICGSKDNFICMDLTYHGGVSLPSTICNQQEANGYDARFRGKTNVDYIAGELSKKPRSVVFLENLDKADLLVQNSLLHAIRNGKFPDSHGREFSINNTIFILTTTTNQDKEISNGDCISFREENIVAVKCSQMTIAVEPFHEILSSSPKANISVTSRQKSRNKQVSLCSVFVSKRKLDSSDDCKSQSESLGSAKRAYKSTKTLLDLNLPVEESDDNDADAISNLDSDNSESWMEDFLNLLDARVNFKAFDFDALADNMLKDLSTRFSSVVGSECLLEIDPKVMEQILAAAWTAEHKEALNNWFDDVLGKSFVELNRRFNLSTHNVVKLNALEDVYLEKYAPGIVLPSKIILD